MKKVYVVNPMHDFPSLYIIDRSFFAAGGHAPGNAIGDLSITTVAAHVPEDMEVRLCDENIGPVDLDIPADFIFLTGKNNQARRIVSLSREFRRRGKTVVVGGPCATLAPHLFRGDCDVLFRGELEHAAAELFADLRSGRWRDEYLGPRGDLDGSPQPRWDLYPTERTLSGSVQTTRGCPFECEYCDVIPYHGRQQRHKPIARVIAELETLKSHGYQTVMLADDNFTVHRSWVKEMLEAIRAWNTSRCCDSVQLNSQTSVDLAKDEELMRMCAQAEVRRFLVGIETVNEASLRETKKRQNLHIDIVEQVRAIVRHGIAVDCGMLVGFDADGPDIFEKQYNFAMAVPVPLFAIGALVAPSSTALRARLQREGRLRSETDEPSTLRIWDTNIVPLRLSREQITDGLRALSRKIYAPEAFGERLLRFIDCFGVDEEKPAAFYFKPRPIELEALSALERLRGFGPAEAQLVDRAMARMAERPQAAYHGMLSLFYYAHIRTLLDQDAAAWSRLATA